jgi:hypothetical protein
MLLYAIYLRIQQYDLTIDRYIVVVFGILLLTISIYFICSKKKRLLAIPVTVTLFTLLISFGPWSIFSLPEARQLARLEANLQKAGILVDGQIVPLKSYEDIDENLSSQIHSGIRYVCYYSDCKAIIQLFGREMQEVS